MVTPNFNSKEAHVYISRLSVDEKEAIFQVVETFRAAQVAQDFRRCVQDVVLDRLILSAECLGMAKRLNTSGALEIELRTSIGRAYYAIHHAIRAIILMELDFDPDSHAGCIGKLKEMIRDNAFAARSGLTAMDLKRVEKAKENRNIADYSPYEFSRAAGDPDRVELEGKTWKTAADFNLALAERMLASANKVIGV